MRDREQEEPERRVGISDMLVPQGALEQRSHLKSLSKQCAQRVSRSTGPSARMRARILWDAVMDVGETSVTTVFPVKFCWVYSTCTQSENSTPRSEFWLMLKRRCKSFWK